MFESLEPRRLLSVSLKGATLFVEGTDRADTINFGVDSRFIHVVLNGTSKRIDKSRVNSINISTGTGNDQITLGTKLKVSSLIYAGSGNDTVDRSFAKSVLAADKQIHELRRVVQFTPIAMKAQPAEQSAEPAFVCQLEFLLVL